jgi:carboxyl-terminal processing protease
MDCHLKVLRTTLMLSTAFLAGVTTGPVSALIGKYGGIAFGAQSISDEISNRADTYWSLALFGDVFERVRLDYVDPVSDKSLIEDALDGMLTGLDPHSGYMNAEAFQEMQAEDAGEFGGVGKEVTVDNGFLRVISAIDGSPAAKAGIKAGDLITTPGRQDGAGTGAGRSHYL